MENHRDNDIVEIDLLEIISILLNRFWVIFGVALLAAAAGFMISKFVLTPTFESTTKIYILNKSENTTVTYSDVQMGTQLTKDYAELINSRYVLETVIGQLSLPEMEYKDLLKKVSVHTPTDTRIVSITVTDYDPQQAQDIANCIREVAGEHIQNVMDIEAVNVVEEANLPTVKAGPSVIKWTAVGGILGVFLVCAVILIHYLLDDSIKSSEDVEKYLGLSTLALIPITQSVNDDKQRNKRK
ncbi:MAG: protein-tyrosine kinase [Lachnospiraceae bacterium]|nr:protein-tyrosine kinase [Lachnospiraceae bacterium]